MRYRMIMAITVLGAFVAAAQHTRRSVNSPPELLGPRFPGPRPLRDQTKVQ